MTNFHKIKSTMYRLPKNFTGYDAVAISEEAFTTLCYSLHGLGAIKVLTINGYEPPNNYYSAQVEDSEGSFHIYMNCFTALICFGNISDDRQDYLSKSELEIAIADLYPKSVVLTKEQLDQAITPDSMVNLPPKERNALGNWLPCTVGRAMFSWFFD